MTLTVGTFNLNNLFSRFNFQAEIDAIPATESGGITLGFDGGSFRARTFAGRLVKAKNRRDTEKIAERIKTMNVDVLAVQEVEHIDILRQFNHKFLDNLYPHVILVEGNDTRLIDVGILSRLPVGNIVSHQTATHPDAPDRRVFGRDLLQVEILDRRGRKLFNLYNTHLKSHFVPPGTDPEQGRLDADRRRQQQAETISRIISRMERSDAKFILLGDMNDPPESPFLQAMRSADRRQLVNALTDAVETRPPKRETAGQGPGPAIRNWTHRFNQTGQFPKYEQFDQIWLSARLSVRLEGAKIDRRTTHGGDGSDHDPAWIQLNL